MRVSLEGAISRPCPRKKTTAVQGCILPGIYAQHRILLPRGLERMSCECTVGSQEPYRQLQAALCDAFFHQA